LIGSDYQENIDFKTLFRYKKASTEKEEACQWDSVEALSKENPQRHSLNSTGIYQQNGTGSNAIHCNGFSASGHNRKRPQARQTVGDGPSTLDVAMKTLPYNSTPRET